MGLYSGLMLLVPLMAREGGGGGGGDPYGRAAVGGVSE